MRSASPYRPLQRDQRFPVVGTSDVQVLGPKPGRRAILIGAPVPNANEGANDNTLTSGADTSTTGIKSTYTVPTGVEASLVSATAVETTGTGVVAALQLVRGATTVNLSSVTSLGSFAGPVDLQAGDVINWRVTTAVALSVADFTINVVRERVSIRVTISFVGVAVLDVGLNIYGGGQPLYLHEDHIGSAIQEEIHAIGSQAALQISVLDLFDS